MKSRTLLNTLLVLILAFNISSCGKDNKDDAAAVGANPITNWNNQGSTTGATVSSFDGLKAAVTNGQFASERYSREGFYVTSFFYNGDATCTVLFWDTSCTKKENKGYAGFRYGVQNSVESGHELFGGNKDTIKNSLIAILNSVAPNGMVIVNGQYYPGYQKISNSVHQVVTNGKIYQIDLSKPIAANPTVIYEISTNMSSEVGYGFAY